MSSSVGSQHSEEPGPTPTAESHQPEEKLVRVTDLQYYKLTSEVYVRLYGRTEDGERFVTSVEGTRPYGFVPADTEPSEDVLDEDFVLDIEDGYAGYDGQPLKRVTVETPGNVNDLESGYKEGEMYESDIPYERRVAADYGLSGYIRLPMSDSVHIDDVETAIDSANVEQITPRVMMADIEVMVPEGNDDFEAFTRKGEQPITAITCYDSYDDEYAVFVLDPEKAVDGGEIREILSEQWGGHGDYEKHANAEITLVRAISEGDLLDSYLGYIESTRPDLLTGWNWIDFDHRYIINRIENIPDERVTKDRLTDAGWVGNPNYKSAEAIDGVPGFDMMESFCGKMTFGEWKSQKLDYVANEEVGVGKLGVSIEEEYENDRTRFVAYNILDTQLLRALDDINGIFDYFYQVSDLCSVRISDTQYELRLVDGFIMARRDKDEILPIQEDSDLPKIAGGLVLSPHMGMEEWVGVLDLKSLYPSVFATLNISRETLVKDTKEAALVCPGMPESEDEIGGEIEARHIDWDVEEGAIGVKTDTEGILPKYLKLIFAERSQFKRIRDEYDPDDPQYQVYDNKQGAIKVIMNSFYGVSQNDYYRMSDLIGESSQNVGSTITSGARYVTWRGSQIAEDMGYTVLYGDTDSIFIQLADPGEKNVTPKKVVERGHKIEAEINDRMDNIADELGIADEHPFLKDSDLHGNERHTFKWEFEKLYRRFLQAGKKKRYAGLPVYKDGKWIVDNPNADEIDVAPDITGFETKRSDMPIVAADAQKQVIGYILSDAPFETVSDYVAEKVDVVKNREVPSWKIAYPKSLKDPLEGYGNTQTARACRYSNRVLGYSWQENENPWIYPIETTPPMTEGTDVLALDYGENIPEGYSIDTREIVEKKMKRPLEAILAVTEWTFEELETGRQMQSISLETGGDDPFGGGGVGEDDIADNPFSSGGISDSSEESNGFPW